MQIRHYTPKGHWSKPKIYELSYNSALVSRSLDHVTNEPKDLTFQTKDSLIITLSKEEIEFINTAFHRPINRPLR